jgi:putative membrane protein
MMGYHYGGWGWVVMSLMMLLFWGGLIGLAVWAVLASRRDRRAPEDVLAHRFARGEITDEEFVRSRDLLTR